MDCNQIDLGSDPYWKQLYQTLGVLFNLLEPHLQNGNKNTHLSHCEN